MSLGASGSVANTIVFSQWKGRPYVRELVTPSNPNTAKQQSVRAMMRFLSQYWALLGSTPKNSWAALAKAGTYSNFNAYSKANLSRWRTFLAPGQSAPIGGTGTAGTLNAQTATAGVKLVTIAVSLTAVNNNWGLLIHRSLTTGFTPDFSTLVHVLPKTTTGSESWVDTPLITGTPYFYKLVPFTTDGLTGAAFAQITATPT